MTRSFNLFASDLSPEWNQIVYVPVHTLSEASKVSRGEGRATNLLFRF